MGASKLGRREHTSSFPPPELLLTTEAVTGEGEGQVSAKESGSSWATPPSKENSLHTPPLQTPTHTHITTTHTHTTLPPTFAPQNEAVEEENGSNWANPALPARTHFKLGHPPFLFGPQDEALEEEKEDEETAEAGRLALEREVLAQWRRLRAAHA